ncbi:tripartite tricarboxylate transporter TctB family protein [Ramlibacter sp.]|uniref:tripartite tricarboxylate transporter TctB family protein n=1 Tax=Ramlibacter sp. TaxID=1917967 RepID=UPI003D1341ED
MILSWLGTLFWVVLGVLIAWQSRVHGLGTQAEPGTGMVSFGLGILIAAIAAGRAAVRIVRGTWQPAPAVSARVVALCGVLVAYFLVFVRLGYVLSTFALLLVLFVAFAELRWSRALIVAAGATAASYALFKFALGVQLPPGILG